MRTMCEPGGREKEFRIRGRATALLGLRIGEFFEDLIDRELQFLARSFERPISLQAQVNIESVKDWPRMDTA